MREFMFATGIENSYPTIQGKDGKTLRVDEMAKCGHYQKWREDFRLVKELGLKYLRYGPPYHTTHKGHGKYDWDFADQTFRALKELGIHPLADLCHFGVPDWIGNFQNEEWPELFAGYAAAFARRYPWVRFYTPVNEILIAALFSAQYGWWNERLSTDRAFVRALKNLCKANVLAMHAILKATPEAIFIQSESSEYFHPEDPGCAPAANFLNEKRFLSLDLVYGHPVNVMMYQYLTDHGLTREEYQWFIQNHVRYRCIMGNDYYLTNEHLVHADGSTTGSGEIFGYYVITHQYYERYKLPVMHTETNLQSNELATDWLKKEWANVHRLRQDGVPIIGFTWYSLTDQKDWDTALREDNDTVNPVGLYDLERKIRPVGHAYQRLAQMWKGVMQEDGPFRQIL